MRIASSSADEDDETCPEFLATKARPGLRQSDVPRDPYARYDGFAPGKVNEVLDRKERSGVSLDEALAPLLKDPKVLAATLVWIRHAAESYVASAANGDSEPLEAVLLPWVAQRGTDMVWELYTWGRGYQSADRSLRELRLLRYGRAGQHVRSDAQIAMAAYTVAFGSLAARPMSSMDGKPAPWGEPFNLVPQAEPVTRVRIVEVGLLDGSHTVLFDGTPDEAAELYATHGRARVSQIIKGGERRPGEHCLKCKQRGICPSLPTVPGLLPIPAQRGPARSWSVSGGRQFAACPQQYHFRQLRLPRLDEYGPEAVRGQAVHAFIAAAHERRPLRGCRRADLPPIIDDWSAGKWHVQGQEALDGYDMLVQHLQVCPLQHAAYLTGSQSERALVYNDPLVNVLVFATPDQVYQEGDARIWREIKTSLRHRGLGVNMLHWSRQLALGVLILSKNLLGGDPTLHRIELETLTPTSANIELLDPSDPEVIRVAEEVIRALADPWHRDDVIRPITGPHCRECPMRQWCPDVPGSADVN